MFNKKRGLLILLLLIVGICAMSSVSASDDVSDVLTVDDAQVDEGQSAIEEVNEVAAAEGEDLAAANEDENVYEETAGEADKLAASEDDSKLTVDESNDKLSMIFANWYSIDLSDTLIASDKQQTIKVYIKPSQISGSYGYDYNFVVLDKNAKAVYTKHYKSTNTNEGTYTMTIAKNTLTPGAYVMAALNDYDNAVMDSAYLFVSGTAAITVNNYASSYMSGAKMTGRITDQVTGKAIYTVNVKAVFSNGKTSVTKIYTPDANGYFSFEPPVGIGTWTVTVTPNANHITGSAVATATITKSGVSIKASKVVEYKGFKTKLKATVKVGGKNVNEGKVAFKINGKTYKVNVKNGVATKKIKLKKVKTYKYSAKYLGTANLKASKKVKAKATLKNRQKVKIKFKKPVVYMGQVKKVVVKITSKGKKVKSGLLYVKHKNGVDKVKVTKGRVVLYAVGLASDHYKGTNGITTYYKKTVTKKFWMKYVPTEHKYKGTKVNYKATSKYKCPTCGSRGSHNHYSYGYFVRYTYHIKVS